MRSAHSTATAARIQAASANPQAAPSEAAPISASTTSAAPAAMAKASFRRCARPGGRRASRQQRADGDRHQQRHHHRAEGGVEVGGPDRDLVAADRVEDQRIERAEQHRGAAAASSRLFSTSAPSRRDRREQAASLQSRRPQGVQRQRAADREHEQQQDEHAALGIDGEGVHRGQHARAHQEGADQRQREGDDRQQDGPAFSVSRFSTTIAEWISAVPTSQGMKQAFSTGSQNHQPPQPSV